jgi:copper(I)-binding protein
MTGTKRPAIARPPARRRIGRALACLLLAIPIAATAAAPDVQVVNVRAREAPPGARTAAIYLAVENRGAVADRLVAARSPRGAVEIHAMRMDGGVMRMRAAPDVPVPARGRVELAPGGLHLMLVDPAPPLKAGERVPVTLTFERAGAVDVQVVVEPLQGAAPHGPH